MRTVANVIVHASQFPEVVQRRLYKSLRTHQINQKFHYDTVKQVQKWSVVSKTYAPWYNDPACRGVYRQSFRETTALIRAKTVHLISLGCGTGQKDLHLIRLLKLCGKEVFYTPCDSSVPMVLTARNAALACVPAEHCHPVVCDIAAGSDLARIIRKIESAHCTTRMHRRNPAPGVARLLTLFGVIPNLEPRAILHAMASVVRHGEYLLLSANLVPGPNPAAGMQKILWQYDNPLTRDWLMTFLLELGIGHADGKLRFEIGSGQLGIKRVVAKFEFKRTATVQVQNHKFVFKPLDTIQLFYSYRYTPDQLRQLLTRHGFTVTREWFTRSSEEAVFCCVRT